MSAIRKIHHNHFSTDQVKSECTQQLGSQPVSQLNQHKLPKSCFILPVIGIVIESCLSIDYNVSFVQMVTRTLSDLHLLRLIIYTA